MTNILNKDGLDDIFDIDSDHESFFDVEEIEDELEDELKKGKEDTGIEEDYFFNNMKSLMEDIQGIIGAAKYLCDTSPEPDAIMAASSMFTSASQLLKELNKSAMQLKRFQFMTDHEKLKIKARMELAKFKAQENRNRLTLSNSTINIQNNNHITNGTPLVSYCQESIVEEVLKQQKLLASNENIIDAE